MRYAAVMMAAAFAALTAAPVAAQPCADCPGDLNHDGTVSIDEVVTVVNSALGTCTLANVLYDEVFAGAQLDAQRWTAATNGYPDGGLRVADGVLAIGTAGDAALDLPFVESAVSPFPDSGDVRLEIALRYAGIGVNGGGVGLVGDNGRSLARIDLRSTGYGGKITVTWPGGTSTLTDAAPFEPHTFAFVFRAGTFLDAFVDDQPIIGNLQIDGYPFRLWLGHPTITQNFGIDETGAKPSGTNDAGTVVERWWTTGTWSPFSVDSIRVTRVCAAE